jgi:hypothetical protein
MHAGKPGVYRWPRMQVIRYCLCCNLLQETPNRLSPVDHGMFHWTLSPVHRFISLSS